MAVGDPNLEWLGYLQPVGLVLSPAVLDRYSLIPEEQIRADSDAVLECLTRWPEREQGRGEESNRPSLADPWTFFSTILGWKPHQVAGLPSDAPLPAGLSVEIEEANTVLNPHWAVVDPEGKTTLLVRIEAPSVKPDQRGALSGWEASPHQRFERLLRETGVHTGLLITDDQLRLVHAPKGETSGWLSWPIRALATVAGRPMLGGLKLALNAFRLHNDTPERRLPTLLKQSRDAQAEVSESLAKQVLGALHLLLRGLHAADEARIAKLAAHRPDHLYGGLLTVLLRLVFLLYAEDRDLVPSATDADSRQLYLQGYGVRSLHAKLTADQARYPDTMEERRGAWARLLVLFRLVHRGGGDDFIIGRGGDLFDPAAYPFLMGQDAAGDPPRPAPVSDGCILGVLNELLLVWDDTLKQRVILSYRTLDVEQIGSVYETVMGFTVETFSGSAMALRGGKNDKVPVFVDLAELVALKGAERQKRLKDHYDVKLSDKVAKMLSAAGTREEVEAALRPRVDERGSPGGTPSPAGSPLLQPTDERRRTGSHYTPRSLTEPIVRHALEPAFERLGPDAKPEDVLALKVCDPAVGSGAFLVETCRQLAARLVKAWERWRELRPRIPEDEDEELHAKRLVAQRCLYGVDRNPRAVELAKLSLWLATLAREHEFTFLDHALKCGDSLVGLDSRQIAAMHWDASKPGLPLFQQFVQDRVAEATKARDEIQSAPDDTMRVVLEQKHKHVEKSIELVRALGDAVISAFFAEDKPRAREKRRATVESWVSGIGKAKWDELRTAAASLRNGEYPIPAFHWEIEYPEVFARENAGFDAVVGNPPFLGGKHISKVFGKKYKDYLLNAQIESSGNADLCARFFRRAFDLVRNLGTVGLIATNTIAQGDTRRGGLRWICQHGGEIYVCKKRYVWPADVAVVVSIIHLFKGAYHGDRYIDRRRVDRISAYLFHAGGDGDPAKLKQNEDFAFIGCDIKGQGFLFDDADPRATPLREYRRLACDLKNRVILMPYMSGEEINESPTHTPRRFVINFGDSNLEAAKQWPELLSIIFEKVRPERLTKSKELAEWPWWSFWRSRARLYRALRGKSHAYALSRVNSWVSVARVRTDIVYSEMVVVFARSDFGTFALLQSCVHEAWARFLSSTALELLRYSPSNCFETFSFPEGFETSPAIEIAGQAYHDHRAALMVARNEGMTKTYNRFHNPDERSEDIVRLRVLHAEMDCAVLAAYGWDDLAMRAEPIFLDETNEDDHTYQGRLFWPSAFRDEVLARQLALNVERHADEVLRGVAPGMRSDAGYYETDEEDSE